MVSLNAVSFIRRKRQNDIWRKFNQLPAYPGVPPIRKQLSKKEETESLERLYKAPAAKMRVRKEEEDRIVKEGTDRVITKGTTNRSRPSSPRLEQLYFEGLEMQNTRVKRMEEKLADTPFMATNSISKKSLASEELHDVINRLYTLDITERPERMRECDSKWYGKPTQTRRLGTLAISSLNQSMEESNLRHQKIINKLSVKYAAPQAKKKKLSPSQMRGLLDRLATQKK